MKPNIGFIGLGVMGRNMALNINKAGYPLYVFDIDERALKALVSAGAQAVENTRQLADACDWIILSLPDTSVVETVLWGNQGFFEHLSPEQVVIDCGTTHPLATIDFHKRFEDCKIGFLDAPVSGMEERAREGALTIMVGGSKEVFDVVKPVLEAMGSTVIYMGLAGSGQLAKVINNVFFNVACATVAELLPLSVKMGLDPEKIIEVAGSGSGQSFALNTFGPLILKREFSQGYPMESAYKDMSAILEVVNKYHIPVPVTMSALSTYQTALNRGLGKESKGAMVKVWEEILGVEVKY